MAGVPFQPASDQGYSARGHGQQQLRKQQEGELGVMKLKFHS